MNLIFETTKKTSMNKYKRIKNKFINYGLIILIVLQFKSTNANTVDSLKQITFYQKDSVLVDTYIQLAKYYFQSDHQPDSMIK